MNTPREDADPQGRVPTESRAWLQRLADAAQAAAETLRDSGDPHSRALLDDLNDLHGVIAGRLRELDE